jgi:hypothetical protein
MAPKMKKAWKKELGQECDQKFLERFLVERHSK